MIEKKLKFDREHTRDYEIVTKEIATRTIKIFGWTFFKNSSDVTNTNTNATTRRSIGLKPTAVKEGMKNLLEFNNNVLVIQPEALVIQEFKRLWDRDKSKGKERALQELAYVYHSTDFQSIYRNYHPSTREAKILLDIFGDREHKVDALIVEAQNKYKELQTTLSMELLNDAEFGLDQLRTYFRNVDFSVDEEGKAAKNFIANLKQLGDLVKGLKSLREEVEKELVDQMQLRGGSTIGRRELPPERRG